MIGVLGGMDPAATADFLATIVALTPARCAQEHLPVLVAHLPQIPDRSRRIVGSGTDPLPHLLDGIALLNKTRPGVVVVPSNSSHHWFDQMQAACGAPMLHIADACARRAASVARGPVLLLASRGTLHSGFHQRALAAAGLEGLAPGPAMQEQVDACIRSLHAGELSPGAAALARALAGARAAGIGTVILACSELSIARQAVPSLDLLLVDSTLELARSAVDHALEAGWNRPRAGPASAHGIRATDHPLSTQEPPPCSKLN